MALISLFLPLVIICIVTTVGFTTGHSLPATQILFLGGGTVAACYSLGRGGIWLSEAITSPSERRKTQTTIAVVVGVVNWGAVLLASVVIPAMGQVEPSRIGRRCVEETVPRAELERLGAKMILDTHGRIINVELHDVSDDDLSVLADLHSIRALTVQGPRVTNRAMAKFSHLQTLEYLCLARTGITSECLRWLPKYPRLQVLNVSDTKVDNSGLSELLQLSDLKELWLSGTNISESAMMHLGKLRELQILHIDRTALPSRSFQELKGLGQLTDLYVGSTNIDDDALATVGALATLEHLHLANTAVTDAGLAHLTGLKRLRNLNLAGTQITDSGLLRLVSLRRLKFLSARGTRVTTAGADAFVKAVPGCSVSFERVGVSTGVRGHP